MIPVRAEPGAIARLRLENSDDAYLAWADNTLAGPIEVMLQLSRGDNVAGEPALPARATVPARGSVLVSRLGTIDPTRDGRSEFRLEVVPGDPSAKPRDVEYGYPLAARPSCASTRASAAASATTTPQNRHAVDFAAEIGTPVVAAREGTVMQVESDFDKAGLNSEKYGGRANFVRILHDDGTHGDVRAPARPMACWCASASACAAASRSACRATPASPPARTCISRCRSIAACSCSRSRSACSGRRGSCGSPLRRPASQD